MLIVKFITAKLKQFNRYMQSEVYRLNNIHRKPYCTCNKADLYSVEKPCPHGFPVKPPWNQI